MGKWLPKFVKVQADTLEVYPDSEGNGAPGTTARLEDIADVTVDEAKGECCITLNSGGRIRARADELELLNSFADALQPGHNAANPRKPKVVMMSNREGNATGVPASNESIVQPEPDVQDQGTGSPNKNLPVHERLYAYSTVQKQKLEQKRHKQDLEEDQSILDSMSEWHAIKQKKEEKRAKDPNFNEDPRDFHERTQAFEMAKQMKLKQRREELFREEQARLEEEREMAMPTRQVGQNYDPYEAADRLYRNALHKGRPKEGGQEGRGLSDFEGARKRKTDEELKAEKEAQQREEAEKRKEKERLARRDKLVQEGVERKKKKQAEAERKAQEAKAKARAAKEERDKSQKAKTDDRRKSEAFLMRNASPKRRMSGMQDSTSLTPAFSPGSRSKSPAPRSPLTSVESAEAGSPRVGRKSFIARKEARQQSLQDRLIEQGTAQEQEQRQNQIATQKKHAKMAERMWGTAEARVHIQAGGADSSDEEQMASSVPDKDSPGAMGARSPRFAPSRDKESHLLERVCEKIEARTGENPIESLDETSPERQAMEFSLKRVRALYAAAEAESRSDGYDDLCKLPNHRLVKGLLLPEGGQDGPRARAGPPDPVFQQMENLDGLMEAGDAAQSMLMEELSQETWEEGETLQLPVNMPSALFAFNPGTMSKDEAHIKGMVLYGPMDGAVCHRNLLDVARLTLVFPTCTVLKMGLEAVSSLFEVVKVQNYFRDPNPLGGRYVDVFVLIDLSQDPGLPYPYVCKLRLETLPYFQATVETEAVLEGLYDNLCGNDVAKIVAQSYLELPEKKLARECRRKFEAHFGSTLAAWRSTFGRKRLATFDAFRGALEKLRDPGARGKDDTLHETWAQFDPSLAGRITYFDFDPDSAALLAKLRARFMMLYAYGENLDDYNTIYKQMTCLIQPKKPLEWDVNEFRAVMMPFCMTPAEVEKVMQLLDQHGGKQTPVIIRIQDIMFLLRLPEMFDVDTAVINSLNMVSKAPAAPPPRDGFGYNGDSPRSDRPKLKAGLTRHLALPAYDEEF